MYNAGHRPANSEQVFVNGWLKYERLKEILHSILSFTDDKTTQSGRKVTATQLLVASRMQF